MRTFFDGEGTEWRVWSVIPDFPVYYERRRRDGASAYQGQERRQGDIQVGWLCFDSPPERRRLHPIPAGWESLPDAELAALLRRAVVTSRPRLADA